jgi:23S rRNA (uridine2479-2'-O)-methyltransferase
VTSAPRVSTRNARFQQWAALLGNRVKRSQLGLFLVQGVRPVTLAVRHGWPLDALLYADRTALSPWARELLDEVTTTRVAMAPELLAELGGREDATPPELVAVARIPPDDLGRIGTAAGLVVVFDRPTSPGNIGTLVRSADGFGADGLVVCGHAADPYDPQAVRASTGSLFALPVVRAPAPGPVLDWAAAYGLRIVGTDEHGPVELAGCDLAGPTLLLVGNETTGLSTAWRAAAGVLARIPIGGAATSLNAAAAGSIALYEVARQRRAPNT